MLLSDTDLREEIVYGDLGIDPYEPALVQPASVDVRLHHLFRVFTDRHPHIDPSRYYPGQTELVDVDEGYPFILQPGQFALASTLETISVPRHLAARLEGKSSLGRLGLLVHSTAGFIDPGFSGQITLELSNVSGLKMRVWPGMRIGQLCLMRLTRPASHGYSAQEWGSRYQGQEGPTESRSWDRWQTWPTRGAVS
jgi:dCTP deaminase